ncbi:hypothetical protein [Sphingomonas sp.]|jgi:hypothetical protein|uniref:hypothetical protein n=1 Tax=Sphingomonas sp. TaxID=28214 RepID=UPI002E37AC42|nr:hypothetical protein [Sphingomonas sp.]HEX4694210.1 hypothetical protein [Sphingomonas sp.]
MTAKTSPARVAAFFRALAETGNRTIAAERAKVSRSWVSLHQSTDPAFAARMTAAVEAARARLRAQATGIAANAASAPDHVRSDGGSVRPPAGWGSLDGEELVVRGTNGRRTQIARARLRQWTPRVEARFLATLAATCNVKAACAEVGLTAASAYGHAKRWPGFAERWRAAIETGYLRIEAALIANAANAMGDTDPFEPELAMPPMSVAQAIHLLHMHKHQVHAIGGRPGKRGWPKSLDEMRPGILRKLELIEAERIAHERIGPATLARDRREWAKRRGGQRGSGGGG